MYDIAVKRLSYLSTYFDTELSILGLSYFFGSLCDPHRHPECAEDDDEKQYDIYSYLHD